jgi:hypothetical protein
MFVWMLEYLVLDGDVQVSAYRYKIDPVRYLLLIPRASTGSQRIRELSARRSASQNLRTSQNWIPRILKSLSPSSVTPSDSSPFQPHLPHTFSKTVPSIPHNKPFTLHHQPGRLQYVLPSSLGLNDLNCPYWLLWEVLSTPMESLSAPLSPLPPLERPASMSPSLSPLLPPTSLYVNFEQFSFTLAMLPWSGESQSHPQLAISYTLDYVC